MSGLIEVLRVTRDDARAWRAMPELLDRLASFCSRMDTDTDAHDMVDLVRALFTTGDPRLGLWVAVHDGKVVGHLLATPEPWGTLCPKYILVRQAEIDKGVEILKETEAVFSEVKTWTKALGLSQIGMLTHRNEQAMARRWGFTPYKSFMRLDLKNTEEG